MTAEAYVVFVSMPRDEARNMAKALVESRQAACVNIIPKIESYFMWQEVAEYDEESLLVIKTSAARFDSMKEFISEVHPYELPEIIAIPITAALPEYVEWIKKETQVTEG